jgi:hypothetical protein
VVEEKALLALERMGGELQAFNSYNRCAAKREEINGEMLGNAS